MELKIKTVPQEMNPKPDRTLAELRAEYMATMEHLDSTAKKATAARQKYEAAQYQASLVRQELRDRELEITSTFNPVAV